MTALLAAWWLAAQVAGGTLPVPASFDLIAPESVLVPVVHGEGSVTLWFAYHREGEPPVLKSTDAVGPANDLPADTITVGTPQLIAGTDKDRIFTVKLSVKAPDAVRAANEYMASLIAPGVKTVRVRIVEVGVEQFAVVPKSVSLAWRVFQDGCRQFTVGNTGNVPISTVATSLQIQTVSGLSISKTNLVKDALTKAIEPGKVGSVNVCLPLPPVAGTYTGTMEVGAVSLKTETVAVSITTRGPTFGVEQLLWLPLALFGVVISCGFVLSNYLEQWFTKGGLQRAEATIALSELAAQLRTVRDRLTAYGNVPVTVGAVELLALEADALRTGAQPMNDAPAQVQRLTCGLYGAQWGATIMDGVKSNAIRFGRVATVMDASALPKDQPSLEKYRNDVETAANQPIPAPVLGPSGLAPLDAAATAAQTPITPSRDADPAALRNRIAFMATLQRRLLWLATGISAYATFYVNNPAFGTSLDYGTVFLWSVALTQAGAQVLAQARWSK